jgi:hypothetical protein
MDGPAREPSVGDHIAAIAERTEPETDRLASMLRARCWPGGSAVDRSKPSATEWLRRWGPKRVIADPLDCSCARGRGRCAVCN